MDRNAELFYRGAKKLGLTVHVHSDLGFLEIIIGRNHYYFMRTLTPLNEGASVFVCKNKFRANQLLINAGYPLPKAVAFTKKEFLMLGLKELIKPLNFPLVAKPMENSGRGTDVLCNIKDLSTLKKQVKAIFEKFDYVQLEEFHKNIREYRVLVLKNKVIGVVERFAASVEGDGIHTIAELIAISNEKRAILAKNLTISPLIYDLEYQQCLEEQGLSLESIVSYGAKIKLCHTVNTGRGGDIISLGKKIHPSNALLLCAALKETGLTYGGFDIICEDINLPFSQSKWMIIEINHNPDLTIHEIPNQGIRVSVINKILGQLIRRHPLSYLLHITSQSFRSKFVKSGLLISFFYLALRYI
ncbi:MAG: UDP-N-acetylmuramyl peptide synthase [Tatlockia sp.]|nr:UDP-N-acetylmuramyl peptide synthase [Tatlockia sp.]